MTLVCEDHAKEVEAHRVVLAASSTFLAGMLELSNNRRVNLNKMKLVDIMAIHDFIYVREVTITSQASFDRFVVEQAKLFGLRGFSETSAPNPAASGRVASWYQPRRLNGPSGRTLQERLLESLLEIKRTPHSREGSQPHTENSASGQAQHKEQSCIVYYAL